MKLVVSLTIVAGLIALIIFAAKFILTLMSGFLNTILAVFVILALVVIVIWMFSYAKKH